MNILTSVTRRAFAGLVLLGLLQGGPLSAAPDQDQTVWAAGDEYVRLTPQETAAAAVNQHPQRYSAEQLALGLKAIEARERDAAEDSAQPLFDNETAERLALRLEDALGKAAPDQDVTFAMLTSRSAGLLGKRRWSSSARAFVTDGQLNLVFGDVLRSTLPDGFHSDPNRNRQIDRRLYPHRPGSREDAVRSAYSLDVKAAGGGSGAMPGRNDWLILDLAELAQPEMEATRPAAPRSEPATLEVQLERLKALRAAELIDEQSYRSLVDEAVRRQLFE